MDIKELDMNGGFFKPTIPYTMWGWIGWAAGLLLVIVGIVTAFLPSDNSSDNTFDEKDFISEKGYDKNTGRELINISETCNYYFSK